MKKRAPMTAWMRTLLRRDKAKRTSKYGVGGQLKKGAYAPKPVTLREIGKPEDARS